MNKQAISQTIVFVEGENEMTYWNKMGFIGKVKKFNFWDAQENTMQGLLRQLSKEAQVIIIADTDVLRAQERFISNVSKIKRHCIKPPALIFQNRNFEDELCFSCGCTQQELFRHFGAQNIDEFKTKFNQYGKQPPEKLQAKLAGLNHSVEKMWARSSHELAILNSHELDDLIQNNSVLSRR